MRGDKLRSDMVPLPDGRSEGPASFLYKEAFFQPDSVSEFDCSVLQERTICLRLACEHTDLRPHTCTLDTRHITDMHVDMHVDM
jgi:hypothetical protein